MIAKKGFTLIELLVVVLIISIITAAGLFAMRGFMEDRRAATLAKELITIIPLAKEQAILQATIIGLKITPGKYQFYRFIINSNPSGNWQPINYDRLLNEKTFSSAIKLNLIMQSESNTQTDDINEKSIMTADKKVASQPQIIFFPSGDMTPFKLYISASHQRVHYLIDGAANGDLFLKQN